MKILIADDHNIMRNLLKRIVKENYPFAAIEEANNGEKLLQKALEQSDWDIIISDISMPFLTGIEAAAELEKTTTAIPIILISAHALKQHKMFACLPKNIAGFIEKDELLNELPAAMELLIAKRNGTLTNKELYLSIAH